MSLEQVSTSYGQYTVPDSEEMINLGVGQPRNSCLNYPLSLMKKYMEQYSKEFLPDDVLQYGDIPGYKRFRFVLSEFLKKYNYDSKCTADNFFQTNGATEAVSLITTILTNHDDIIIVENPTYFLMINIFKELGREVFPIDINEEGYDYNQLDNILSHFKRSSDSRVLFYGIPFNHNPTGFSWSEQRKKQLVNLLNRYDNFYVMTDEVYQLLDFNKSPEKPLADYHERILTIGSFSKVIAPAFRIGWIYNKGDVLDKFKLSAARDSSGGNNVINSLIVERMLVNGDVDKMLVSERKRLYENLKYIEPFLKENLSKYFIFNIPKGGYFLWLKLRSEFKFEDEIFEKMEEFKVKFHRGNKFGIGDVFRNYLRLSLSFYTKEDILRGCVRLLKLMKHLDGKRTIKNNFDKIGLFGHNGRLGSLIASKMKMENIMYNNVDSLENIGNFDCIVDVTSTQGTNEMIKVLQKKKYYPTLIVGTTGHGDETKNLFEEYGKYGRIYYLSNFSTGIQMLKQFIKENSSKFENYQIKLEETHHLLKKDSPSGTALSLSKCFEHNNVRISSIRQGDVFGEHKLIISNDSEVIEITHSAKNRELFSNGCVNFLKNLEEQENGYYEI